jgi:hypothetical protein
VDSPSDFVPRSSYDSVSVGVVLRSQCIALVSVSTDFVPHSIRSSVSIKKDYLGSSTVQASGRRRTVGRRSIDRLVGGRCTRSVDRYTRCSVGRRDRTVGKRLPSQHVLPHSIGGRLVERREEKESK